MNFVIDINQDQFLEEVVKKSKIVPVIVDFGPLGVVHANNLPVLESVVKKKNGKIIL